MNSKLLISSIYFKGLFYSKYENLWYANILFLDEFLLNLFFLPLKIRGGGEAEY